MMGKITLVAAIGGMLLLGAACGGGGEEGDATATSSAAAEETGALTVTPDPALSVRCIDQSTLEGPGPFEVGEEPVFFRFGLPDEVLQSGDVCPGDLRLVSLRITADIGDREPGLRYGLAGGDHRFVVAAERVEVPGEEETGVFYNAVVELPGPGRWEFTVGIAGVSGTYVVPVQMPPAEGE